MGTLMTADDRECKVVVGREESHICCFKCISFLVTITLGSYNYICFTILERLLDSAAKYKPISVQFTMNSLVLLLYVSFVLLVYV
ncbi:hypothetical protein Q1695_010249 [Nippostrongylus brasiliensis]|nr:hypothetical protein Q1695_010249 [Nippostrongylus brasiliensis]